jgi:hypothetical protein
MEITIVCHKNHISVKSLLRVGSLTYPLFTAKTTRVLDVTLVCYLIILGFGSDFDQK